MLLYAAALAVMFVCQNGLTRVIQAPPRRPRPPRKAASRGPPKKGAPPIAPAPVATIAAPLTPNLTVRGKGAPPNPLGSITITTPARPTRWLLLALASIARAGHDSEETYVIQALRPEAIPSLDVAVPDGVSNIALSAGSANSTRVDYAVARRTFEWSRQAADGSTVTEQAPLFGDLIDAVKWYADREEGDAGEPPDFAPGTNARRRTALKKPPTRPSRLLSAMSFRSTRSLGQPSPHSAASSRKSLPPSSG